MAEEKDPHRFFLGFGEFDEVNRRLGENQPEYQTLPAYAERGRMVFRMTLTPEQVEMITQTGEIWFEQLTKDDLFQPVRASALKDDIMKPQTQILLPEVLIVFSKNTEYLDEFQGQVVDQNSPDLQTSGELMYAGLKTGSELSDAHNFIIIDLTTTNQMARNYIEQFCHDNRREGRCIIVLTTDNGFGHATNFHKVALKDN